MKHFVLGHLVLASALLVFAAPVFGDDMSVTNSTATTTSVTPSDFVWNASLINLKEIYLGQVAQTNSQNEAVHKFGKRMVRDHSRLQDRLAMIAKAGGYQLPDTNVFSIVPETAPPEEKEATELMTGTPEERLQRARISVHNLEGLTGSDFDHAYADAMVEGHAKAVDFYQNACASLQDAPLHRYAQRGLSVVRTHYALAQKLQSEVDTNAPAGTNAAPNM